MNNNVNKHINDTIHTLIVDLSTMTLPNVPSCP